MNFYRASLILGVLPLLVGGGVLLSWFMTKASWLTLAGLYTIFFGVACFVIGIGCVAAYIARGSEKNRVRKSLIPLTLLISNFPAALGAVYFAEYEVNKYVIEINNQTSSPVEDFRVIDGKKEYKISQIQSGGSVTEVYGNFPEGVVKYKFTYDEVELEGLIFGYVTSGTGRTAIVTIRENGDVSVEEKSNKAN